MMQSAPDLAYAFEARIEVSSPLDLGATQIGRRLVIPIEGGSFEGQEIRGRILSGGGDWQIIRADGVAEIDARYTLETEDGGLIYISNSGLRHGPPEVLKRITDGEDVDPGLYYFRTTASFETSSQNYIWLTKSIFVGIGERRPSHVVMRFWKVL